jgi:ESX secretion-associated protein EspL
MANHHPEEPQIGEGQPGDALLRQADRLQSALDDYQHLETTFFSGADEAKTVRVTVDGGKRLADLYIEEGLLRLGSETVQQRLNEALLNANAAATGAVGAEQEKLLETLGLTAEVMEKFDSLIENLQPGRA